MRIVFMDESGFSYDWKADLSEQPFCVLAGVCLDIDVLPAAYDDLRSTIDSLDLPGRKHPIGKGAEIKAKDIASGRGWWKDHNDERNAVRDAYLGFPKKHGGVAFVVVINKAAHMAAYPMPDPPHLLALKFMLERLERSLTVDEEHGYCVYDQNKREEDRLHDQTAGLLSRGSRIKYHSDYYDEITVYDYEISRIIEMAFGASHNSIGLQVADYFATMTYQHFKADQPAGCGWWDLLKESLHTAGSKLDGVGLKVFP